MKTGKLEVVVGARWLAVASPSAIRLRSPRAYASTVERHRDGVVLAHDVFDRQVVDADGFTALVFAVARPVAGVGIVTPSLVPPLVAALAAIWLGGHFVAAVAYVAGTFGTLVGADLLNMPRVRLLQAPMVSIGGAGTFDGVFLTGLVAVLLASL